MAATAAGTFQVTGWDESTITQYEGDSKLTRARITQAFAGGLAAAGPWEGTMFYRADGTAQYTGLQRLEGDLDGRAGTFVLRSDGEYDGQVASNTWTVVPGSGTGALEGLTGEGRARAPMGEEGEYSLAYVLD